MEEKIMVTIALEDLIALKQGNDLKNYYSKEIEEWKTRWTKESEKTMKLEQELKNMTESLAKNGYEATAKGWKRKGE